MDAKNKLLIVFLRNTDYCRAAQIILPVLLINLTFIHGSNAEERSSQSQPVMEKITVYGKKLESPYATGNMDLIRSEDDVQPYISIDRSFIENSGASTVEDLMRTMLPMSTGPASSRTNGWTGSSSSFNLRGLGADQTLVLINGRRGAGIGKRGRSNVGDQQNVNNIPLAAIERIEVLPTSASAIYGGNALGGVINVILRRDYEGAEVNVRYGDSFDSNQGDITLNFTGGLSLEEGRTRIMLTAQRQESNRLLAGDRDFHTDWRADQLRNNPDAIYGMNGDQAVAPPYGNLVNVRSRNGSPLFPDVSDASYLYLPSGYAGWEQDGVEPLYATLGQYDLNMFQGMPASGSRLSRLYNLVPESDSDDVRLSITRDFSQSISVFLDANYSENENRIFHSYHNLRDVTISADNPHNPFGQDVQVSFPVNSDFVTRSPRYNRTRNSGASLGFNWQLTSNWLLNGDITYSKAHVYRDARRRTSADTRAYNEALAAGTVNVLRDTMTYNPDILPYWSSPTTFADQELNSVTLRAFGTLATWYAGDITLATGLEYRKYKSEGRPEHTYLNDPSAPLNRQQQDINSYYSELSVPLISSDMNVSFIEKLEVQLAGRYENYDATGNELRSEDTNATFEKFSPTVGFSLSPNSQIMLRASYSEGFKTPTITEISDPVDADTLSTIIDPITGLRVDVSTVGGGNPGLDPEEAKSTNVGLVLTPEAIAGLRLSIDYFKIKKENNITSLSAQNIVNNESVFGSRVQRDDNDNIVSVDTTPFNALWLETSGVDIQLGYNTDLKRIGLLKLDLAYTYTDKYDQQESLNADASSYLNDPYNEGPIRHRATSTISLQPSELWSIGWSTQYYGKYRITANAALLDHNDNRIPSQIYHDMFARVKLPFNNIVGQPEIGFGIKNVFNESQADYQFSNMYYSTFSDPGLRQYYANIKLVF